MFLLLARAEPGQVGMFGLKTLRELADQTRGRKTGPLLLSPFKPHPMSPGTEGGRVSHWSWPKELRTSVLSEVLEQVRKRKDLN